MKHHGKRPGARTRARRRAGPGLAALACLVLTAGLVPSPAVADPLTGAAANTDSDRKEQLDRQLDDLREALEGTSKSLVDAALDLQRARSDLIGANATLATARTALDQATAADDVLAGRLAVALAAVAKARRELEARGRQEAETRSRLGGIAREAYVSSGLSALSIALNAESPEQFADRISTAGTVLRQQNGMIDRLDVQQAETRARRSRLVAAGDQVAELKVQAAALVVQRQDAQQAAAAASAAVQELVALQERSVTTIAARKAAEQQRVDALQKQENQLAALLRARDAARAQASRRSAGASSGSSGLLSYPVSAPITSGFGLRFHPILHIWRLHAGTDFGAPCGTPVRAVAPGTVVRAGWEGGFGNQLLLDNGVIRGKNIATSYNHLSRFVVRSGTVRRGQVIAYSGTSGLSTGCHLHFEVYVNGTHVNPMGWL